MPEYAGPMLSRWELGNALRRIRDERGMTIAEVTAAMKEHYGSSFSPTKLSRMETAKRGVIPRDVHDLCMLYGVPDEQRERLIALAKSSRETDEWYGDTDPSGYRRYVALEQIAIKSTEYTMTYIPGLLQTAEYALTVESLVHLAGGYYDPMLEAPERADDRVDLRLRRQQLLSRDNPLQLHAIIDENALRRRLQKPGVMSEQLHHLISESRKPNIDIQVMPLDIGLYPGAEASYWSILEFPPGDQYPRKTAYAESALGGRLIKRELDVTRLASAFEVMSRMALNPAESRALMERAVTDH
ncbi:MAG TPA: helix-turn-helix transcriptional regulator [Actinospica sp.]|nr:helix-turn-helix transcriptional regulator [Actinospica sp.]